MSSIVTDTHRNTLYGSITAASQSLSSVDVSEFNNVLIMIQGTYAGVSIVWEGSMDGVFWAGIQAVRTDAGTAELNSGALTANQVRAWDIFAGPFNYFRVRSTTWTSGQADIWCAATACGVDPAIVATIGGVPSVQGLYAHSFASTSAPVGVGGQTKSTVDTTLVDGDTCTSTFTTARQLITKDFGSSELDWTFTVGGQTTTTTAAPAKTAGAASVRNYVTAIQAINTSATATRLLIQDGATTVFQITLPANMTQPENVVFPTPLRGTAATALNYNFSVAGATVDLNIQGFQNF